MKHRKNSECFPVSLFFASLDTGDWVLQLIHSWIWMCLIMTKWFIFFVNFSFLKDLRDTLNYTLYTSYFRKSFAITLCSWTYSMVKMMIIVISKGNLAFDQHFGALHRLSQFSTVMESFRCIHNSDGTLLWIYYARESIQWWKWW